jgi:hypothetical protein
MQLDAFVLVATALLMGVLLCWDWPFRSWLPGLGLAVAAGFAVHQSFWLLGEWSPGAAGYPWPRLAYDASILFVCFWRTIVVWKSVAPERRRCRELARLRLANARRFKALIDG